MITNLREMLDDESSGDDESMPGLQDRAHEDSSSSSGSSMFPLQARVRVDFSSDDDNKSCDEDSIYDTGEHCCYKEHTLNQIIGGDSGTLFPSNSVALFKYSILGPDQSHNKCRARPKSEFNQAKE